MIVVVIIFRSPGPKSVSCVRDNNNNDNKPPPNYSCSPLTTITKIKRMSVDSRKYDNANTVITKSNENKTQTKTLAEYYRSVKVNCREWIAIKTNLCRSSLHLFSIGVRVGSSNGCSVRFHYHVVFINLPFVTDTIYCHQQPELLVTVCLVVT
jgi:hypothetical protein